MVKRLITSTVILLTSSACSYGIGMGSDVPGARAAAQPVQLQVTNQSGGPVEVYAAGSGTSYRVGTVHPGFTGRFAVRQAVVGNGAVEFTARSTTGLFVESGPMLLRPGDVVDFGLTTQTATSTATVRSWTPPLSP